jgi:hypothetical protein
MKFHIDINTRRFVRSAAAAIPLETLFFKRRDAFEVEVVFVDRTGIVPTPAGTSFLAGIKSSFGGDFLALTNSAGVLDLHTTGVETLFADEPEKVSAYFEIKSTTIGEETRTHTLQIDLQNAVILGDEGVPADSPSLKASQAEAQAGISNDKWMTPLRTAEAIAALATGGGGGGVAVTWSTLIGKPSTFTPSAHTHAYSDITGKPATFAPSAHTHAITDTTGLADALAAKISGTGVGSIEVVQSLPATLVPTTFYILIPSGATAATSVQLGSIPLFTGSGGGGDNGGGGGSWAPTDLANLALWLDATSGLYDSASGGGAVTTNGAYIARWEDRSGNARHFTQATINNRPTLATSALNSKNTVTFDGTDDFLDATYSRSYAAQTLFIVFAISTAKTQGGLFSESEAGATDISIYTGAIQRTTEVGSFVDGASTTRSPKIYTLGAYCIGTFTHSGSQILNYINAAPGQTFSDTFPSGQYNVARGRISGRINSGGSLNAPGANSIGEVIAYDRLLPTSERDAVHAYLSTKWGIAL